MWDHPLIRKAIWIATKAHDKQERWQKVPFILHPFRVACIVAEDDESPEAFATALLHDVLEDTKYKLLEFPADVRLFVECLTEKAEIKDSGQRRMLSLEKLDFVQSDIPTRVKIADRIDNLRDAALSDNAKSFNFYRPSTMELLRIAEKRNMSHEYGYEQLFDLIHGYIESLREGRPGDISGPETQAFFDTQQSKYMVKASKGNQYDPMLYPGPPLGDASF